MNKYLSVVSAMLLGLLLWTAMACKNEAAPVQETPTPMEQDTTTPPASTAPAEKSEMDKFHMQMRTLMVDEDNSVEPCTAYRVVDGNNASISISAELTALLACPGFVSTSVVGNVLLVNDDTGDLLQYDYEEQTLHKIVDLPANSDGLSHVRWSSDNKKLAFIDVNQDAYAEKTKLYVLSFLNGELTDQTTHSVKVNFSCGSDCSPAENDFGFVDNETIYYRTYDKAPYDIDKDNNKTTLALTQ